MSNYLTKPAVSNNMLKFLTVNTTEEDEGLKELARLKIASPLSVDMSFKTLKNKFSDTCSNKLSRLNTKEEVQKFKTKVNKKLNSFKQEYQGQNFHYNATDSESRTIINNIEERYPFISWLNHFEIDIPEKWSTIIDRTPIELMLGINYETPLKQPVNETRIDDLIKELAIANNIMILDEEDIEDINKEDIEFIEYIKDIQNLYLEFEKKVLIIIDMTINRCHPPTATPTTKKNGGKNKRRRTNRYSKKNKRKSRRGKKKN